MTDMSELNLEEIEQVAGGKNEMGLETKPKKKKAGCKLYQIKKGDTLGKIAKANGTTVAKIMELNPNIKNRNLINIGCWLWLPA